MVMRWLWGGFGVVSGVITGRLWDDYGVVTGWLWDGFGMGTGWLWVV